MSAGIDFLLSPQEFFRGQVTSAIRNQRLDVSEEVEFYLVQLLCKFIVPHTDENPHEFLDTPLAMILKDALEAPANEQADIFKKIGDFSLYLAGYFQESFNRKTYDVDYFITMGSGAYANASAGFKANPQRTKVLCELSERFPQLTDILAEIGESQLDQSHSSLLTTYHRWAKSGSERLLKKLLSSGISPIPVDTSKEN